MPNLKYEPAVVAGALQVLVAAVIGLAVAFGAPVTDEQAAAIVAAVTALTAVVSAFAVRARVTPVAKLDAAGVPVPHHEWDPNAGPGDSTGL